MNTVTAETTDRPAGAPHPVVSRTQWLEARRRLLEREKALTRLTDAVARERRALPWVKVEKDYTFDAPDGRRVKSTIHWVSAAHAIEAEVRLYDHLFQTPDPGAGRSDGDWKADLNPRSLERLAG